MKGPANNVTATSACLLAMLLQEAMSWTIFLGPTRAISPSVTISWKSSWPLPAMTTQSFSRAVPIAQRMAVQRSSIT